MPRRARPAAPDSALVAWGWYAVTAAPLAPVVGGPEPGLVPRLPEGRAFWAAWWTADPRRDWQDPDDFGFVEGAPATISGEAITVADRRVREAMGQRVFAVSVGEHMARRAFREGAPQRRVDTTDFEAIGLAWLEERGLPATAIPVVVKAAWREWLKAEHGGEGAQGIDMEAEKKRYQAALALAIRGDTERRRVEQRADIAAGKRPADDRPAIKKAKTIAREVRERLEVVVRHVGGRKDMSGFCHFAALGLVAALRAEGLHAVEASTGGHSFAHVLLDGAAEPLLLDITASQYGLAPVYVRLPGQRRSWAHGARVKGRRAREGAEQIIPLHLTNAPPKWWAVAPAHLLEILVEHGTRLATQKDRARVLREQARAIAPAPKKRRAGGRAAAESTA